MEVAGEYNQDAALNATKALGHLASVDMPIVHVEDEPRYVVVAIEPDEATEQSADME